MLGRFERVALGLALALSGGLASAAGLGADDAAAPTPRDLVTAGLSRKTASPPDLTAARTAFEAAARGADDTAAGEALLLLGELHEESGEYLRAEGEYEQSRTRAPSNRYAAIATTHLASLKNHAEGGFTPLRTLDRVRRAVRDDGDRKLVDGLARELEGFPPGRVKAEARMLVAESYLRQPETRVAGENQLRALVREPKFDPVLPRLAAKQLVDSYIAAGDLQEAKATAVEFATHLDPKYVEHVRLLSRRPALVLFTRALVVGSCVLAAAAFVRHRARLAREIAAARGHLVAILVFAGVVGGVGGSLASNFETGTGAPFYAFAMASTPFLMLFRLWGALSSPSPLQRAARFSLAGGSMLALAFLILLQMNPMFLESFHL